MFKHKLIMFVVIVLLTAMPVTHFLMTAILRANVAIGPIDSTHFKEEELLNAIKVVKNDFNAYNTKRINRIWYDEARSMERIKEANEEIPGSYDPENSIVLLCDFETSRWDYVWPNTKRTNIEFLLVRQEKGGKWTIVDGGEA